MRPRDFEVDPDHFGVADEAESADVELAPAFHLYRDAQRVVTPKKGAPPFKQRYYVRADALLYDAIVAGDLSKLRTRVQAEALQLCCLMTGRGGDAEAGRKLVAQLEAHGAVPEVAAFLRYPQAG